MIDENKPHEPVLLPKEEGASARLPSDEPFLFSEDHREDRTKPPYLLIALMLFGVLGAFWKMAVRKDIPVEPVKKPAKIKVYN